eukprot:6096780-Prymnesium_polylepis.1
MARKRRPRKQRLLPLRRARPLGARDCPLLSPNRTSPSAPRAGQREEGEGAPLSHSPGRRDVLHR